MLETVYFVLNEAQNEEKGSYAMQNKINILGEKKGKIRPLFSWSPCRGKTCGYGLNIEKKYNRMKGVNEIVLYLWKVQMICF
jgi:hypothetical protein